jgi:hypothetical protein
MFNVWFVMTTLWVVGTSIEEMFEHDRTRSRSRR